MSLFNTILSALGMVVQGATILSHHPAPAPLARQRCRCSRVSGGASGIGGGQRRLIGHCEQVAARIGSSAAAQSFAEENRVAQAVGYGRETALAQKVEYARLQLTLSKVVCPRGGVAAVAKPVPLVPRIVVLARPRAIARCSVRGAKKARYKHSTYHAILSAGIVECRHETRGALHAGGRGREREIDPAV